MSDLALTPVEPPRPAQALFAFLAASVVAHLFAFSLLSQVRPSPAPDRPRALELVAVEVVKPRPPEPPPEQVQPKRKPKAAPLRVAKTRQPPPKTEAPPPPNEKPPEEAKPAPLVVGLTLSSTTTAGSFAAPVGNTLYGKSDRGAKGPAEVQAYAAPKYVPSYQVDSPPIVDGEYKVPYPKQAKLDGVEGAVVLSVTVDFTGKVVAVKVLQGPGHGLDEAARDALFRFRFKPAVKGGEPVSTEIKYNYRFELPEGG